MQRIFEARNLLLAIRFFLAISFFWATFDKLIGLGYPNAWMHGYIFGGDPVAGFLNYGLGSWFSFLFKPLLGISGPLNIVIIGAFLLLGTSMLLGIGTKLSAIFGQIMIGVFFIATIPIADEFLFNFRIIYIICLFLLCSLGAYNEYSLRDRWMETTLVKRFPWLE